MFHDDVDVKIAIILTNSNIILLIKIPMLIEWLVDHFDNIKNNKRIIYD